MRKSLLITLLFPFAAMAGSVYRCEANGRLQFQDRPCPGSRADEHLVEIRAFRLLNSNVPAVAALAAPATPAVAQVEAAKPEAAPSN